MKHPAHCKTESAANFPAGPQKEVNHKKYSLVITFFKKLLTSAGPVIFLLIIWEITARTGILPGRGFIPPFSKVLKTFKSLLESGVLESNFFSTLIRVAIGFLLGGICGIAAGILMGAFSCLDKAFKPLLTLIMPIPALGWLPILIILFGISNLVPILVIFICSFFPVLYNTSRGIRDVPRIYINAARTMGANEFEILFKVIIPMALPNIFTGLRLEAGMAWRTVIAAEMVAIPTGIGALLMKAESLVRLDIIIVCLILLSVMSLLFETFFIYLEKKLTSQWI
jgi:NitT/TauT family transport system permease protein